MTAKVIPFPLEERRRRMRADLIRKGVEAIEGRLAELRTPGSNPQLMTGNGSPGFAFRLRPGDFVMPEAVCGEGVQMQITSYCGVPVPPA